MSSDPNLLLLNVDSLFQQNNVHEIDTIQKKIQSMEEDKREELRQMVGERYRDLLTAADTIAVMQKSSETLISQLDSIGNACRSLNEQQLIGFKIIDTASNVRSRSANKQLLTYFSTMIQLKILTVSPELIWSHIDLEHFYRATELFAFSRHINTGLQLDTNNPVKQLLPVAKRQWEVLKPFQFTIKHNVVAVLEREEVTVESSVDCLLALLLLEKTNLNRLFSTFLQLRCGAFLKSLTDSGDKRDRKRVKEHILSSLKVLNGTLNLLEKCFLSNGLLEKKLLEYSDPKCLPTIAYMDNDDKQFSHLLPEIISNFRPKFDAQKLDNSHARNALEQWLRETQKLADVHLQKHFPLVTTINLMQDIKNEILEYRKTLDFSQIVDELKLTTTPDFFESQYIPLINQRMRDIIRDGWAQTMSKTLESIKRTLSSNSTTISDGNEQNLWLESVDDLPLSLKDASNDGSKISKLLLKTKGYGNSLTTICAEFDQRIGSIISEMETILQDKNTKINDKSSMIEFLRDIAYGDLLNFVDQIKRLDYDKQQRNLIFMARLYPAIIELCPNLKICFCQQSNWRQWMPSSIAQNLETWSKVCILLEEESFNTWQIIIDDVLEKNHIQNFVPTPITYDHILKDFPNWLLVTIEQKDDQNSAIQSSFRIPGQPLISLQSYLFAIICDLNNIVPQTLPSTVLQSFNRKLLGQILLHYQSIAAQQNSNSSYQNVSLQLYFDLRFLQSALRISRDDKTLSDEYQTLENTFKDLIDPFDFELFAEHIALNVKKSVGRFSGLFGVLFTTNVMQSSVVLQNITQEEEPNLLSLSSCGSTPLWFPLLPIVMPSSNEIHVKPKRITTIDNAKPTTPQKKGPSTNRKNDATKSKSGASSFFGAMSQEWFR